LIVNKIDEKQVKKRLQHGDGAILPHSHRVLTALSTGLHRNKQA